MPKGLQRTARALLTLAVVSLGAQAGAAPVVIWHFGTIHPWLVFANLLVVPLVTIAIWSGLVGLLGLLLEAGAIVLAPFAWMLATLAGLVSGLSSLPGAALEASRWVGLWLGGLVGFVTLLAYVSSSSRTWYSTSMTSSSVEEG